MLTKLQSKLFDNRYVFLSIFITSVILLAVFIDLGYYPFGDKSILRVDLYHQYAPFHEELRYKLLNGESLMYSWSTGLGKELLSQIAYYTASPFSLLILFFPVEHLSEAMAFFVFCKISFSSGIFAYYLKKSYRRNDLSIVIFALCYAFMSYFTSFYWNVMWLDCVMLFPLVALGIERLVRFNKSRFYCVSLFFAIVVNFYIGFLICIFSVLYFLVTLFSKYSIKDDKEIIFRRIVKFGVNSLIAGGMTMFLAIPTAIALSHTQTSDVSFPNFEIYETFMQTFLNHFVGARPVVLARNEDLPNIYSGLLSIIILPFFITNKKIKLKERILYILFMAFMLLCSSVKPLDYLIHGLHFPANLPHRYTFIYSFFLISIAYRTFVKYNNINIKNGIKIIFGYSIFVIILEKFYQNKFELERVLTDKEIILNVLLMIVYIFLLALYKEYIKRKVFRNRVLIIILMFVIGEVTYSCLSGLSYTGTVLRDDYIQYIDSTEKLMNYLKENDEDDDKFYRQEFRRFTAINEGSIYHYNGFSQFSSLTYGDTAYLMEKLGIASTSNSYRFYDPTPLLNSIFNIKYLMNKDGYVNPLDYTLLEKFGNVDLYKSNKYLSLGFMTDLGVLNWDIESSNPFETQNNFVKSATHIYDKILKELEVEEFGYRNIDIREVTDDGYYKYDLENTKDLDIIPFVSATVKNKKKQRVFLYVDAGNASRFNYTIGDKTENREISTGKSLIDCGIVDEGQEIQIEFELTRKGKYEKAYRPSGKFLVKSASFDYDVFEDVFEELEDEQMIVDSYGGNFINGIIDVKEDGILFTSIPYDSAWKVYVNGKKIKTTPVGKGLIGIPLFSGKNTIRFDYTTKGLFIGAFISLFSFFMFIIYGKVKHRE